MAVHFTYKVLAECKNVLTNWSEKAKDRLMIERHVSTLSGASVELTTEDLQKWTKAYKEDKSHVAAFMNVVHCVRLQ